MCNLKATLLLSFVITIHVQNTETKQTLYYKPIAEEKAVGSLVEIQPKQALPLVLLLNNVTLQFESPKILEKVFTNEGRLINGTQFALESKTENQMLFCPEKKGDNRCLAPETFQDLQPLECEEEPLPQIEVLDSIACGVKGNGKLYRFFYEACPRLQELKYSQKIDIEVLKVCYDEIRRKTVFAYHEIAFPPSFDSKALRQEHNIKYKMTTNDKLIPSNIHQLELIHAQTEEAEAQHQTENQDSAKHIYKLQKFAPPEDLTFAFRRKVTYDYYNVGLQHEALISLWNEINDHIRSYAKKMYATDGIEFSVQTGVVDLPTSRKDNQMSNIWVKILLAPRGTEGIRGMAILMNNFIGDESESATPSELSERSVIDYCENDSCEDALQHKFEKIGGRVRCCSVNKEIEELFNWHEDDLLSSEDEEIETLRIPGINEIEKNSSDDIRDKKKLQ